MDQGVTEDQLVRSLVDAQRQGRHDIDPAPYAGLDRAAAYRIQTGTLAGLGESVGMLKTAVHSDGMGVAAPIYASRIGLSGSYRLPAANVVGLELEVGLVLARDVTPGSGGGRDRGGGGDRPLLRRHRDLRHALHRPRCGRPEWRARRQHVGPRLCPRPCPA